MTRGTSVWSGFLVSFGGLFNIFGFYEHMSDELLDIANCAGSK